MSGILLWPLCAWACISAHTYTTHNKQKVLIDLSKKRPKCSPTPRFLLPTGFSVLQVTATDEDSGLNGELVYRIDTGEQKSFWRDIVHSRGRPGSRGQDWAGWSHCTHSQKAEKVRCYLCSVLFLHFLCLGPSCWLIWSQPRLGRSAYLRVF